MNPRSQTDAVCTALNAPTGACKVHLARWVNEPLPNAQAILSGREIARLTRRPRWILIGMAMLGTFPKQRTHGGKAIGWHRADVLDWLTQHMATEPEISPAPPACQQQRPSQTCLPFENKTSCRHRLRTARPRCAR